MAKGERDRADLNLRVGLRGDKGNKALTFLRVEVRVSLRVWLRGEIRVSTGRNTRKNRRLHACIKNDFIYGSGVTQPQYCSNGVRTSRLRSKNIFVTHDGFIKNP